jgi:conjugal transfer/entry exclusion protein
MRTKLKDIVRDKTEDIENKIQNIIASQIQEDLMHSIRETDALENTILDQLTERISMIEQYTPTTKSETKQPGNLLGKNLPLPF